jgi:hypothetical protein
MEAAALPCQARPRGDAALMSECVERVARPVCQDLPPGTDRRAAALLRTAATAGNRRATARPDLAGAAWLHRRDRTERGHRTGERISGLGRSGEDAGDADGVSIDAIAPWQARVSVSTALRKPWPISPPIRRHTQDHRRAAAIFPICRRRMGKGALAPCPPSISERALDGGHAIALSTLRCARNDEESLLLRQNSSTGKSPKSLSSPSRKNIPLNLSGKSAA